MIKFGQTTADSEPAALAALVETVTRQMLKAANDLHDFKAQAAQAQAADPDPCPEITRRIAKDQAQAADPKPGALVGPRRPKAIHYNRLTPEQHRSWMDWWADDGLTWAQIARKFKRVYGFGPSASTFARWATMETA